MEKKKRILMGMGILVACAVVGIVLFLAGKKVVNVIVGDSLEEETTTYQCDCMLFYEQKTGFINKKIEGVEKGGTSVVCGDYIYSVFFEEYQDYSIKIFETAGEDSRYVKDIKLKEHLFEKVTNNSYFEVRKMFEISDMLVVICDTSVGFADYCKLICFDVTDIENIEVAYETLLSVNSFAFFEKDDCLYAMDRESIEVISFDGNIRKLEEFKYEHDGRMEVYVTAENMYFMTRKNEKDKMFFIEKISYKDGIFESDAIEEIKGCLLSKSMHTINGASEENELGIYENNGELRFIVNESHESGSKYYAYRLNDKLEVIEKASGLMKQEALEVIGCVDETESVMYPWEDGKILSVSKSQGDVKLTMYTINVDGEMLEETSMKLQESSSLDTMYKEKTPMIDVERNIIGIGVSSYDNGSRAAQDGVSYYIISYEEGNFVKKAYVFYENYKPHIKYGSVATTTSGVRMGDYYYVANTGGEISVISLDTYEITKINCQ